MCVVLARLCSWSHMCTGCTYTYTPVSFYRKSMAGYIRLALCRNNASCASSLCRPSPFYSLSLCLCLLVPRQNRGPTATSKNAWGLSFMVCSMACKSCKGSIHEQWSGKGHGHLNFSPRDGEKPKINDHAFLWIIFPIRVVKGDCDLHFVSLFSPFLRSDSFWDVCLFFVCRQNFARRQLISIS